MTDKKSQIDQRPFRSKSDQQCEVALQTQYHNLGIAAVVAALRSGGAPTDKVATENMS